VRQVYNYRSHEIARKIRRAKKLNVKIRETKALEADGRISNQTVATCAMIARMKSSVKVTRHKMDCGKELAGGRYLAGLVKRIFARRVLARKKRNCAHSELSPDSDQHVLQRRFCDCNVWSARKRIEKLRSTHRNPAKRGLVLEPEQWA